MGVTLHLVTLRKIFPCFLHFSLTWLEFSKGNFRKMYRVIMSFVKIGVREVIL